MGTGAGTLGNEGWHRHLSRGPELSLAHSGPRAGTLLRSPKDLEDRGDEPGCPEETREGFLEVGGTDLHPCPGEEKKTRVYRQVTLGVTWPCCGLHGPEPATWCQATLCRGTNGGDGRGPSAEGTGGACRWSLPLGSSSLLPAQQVKGPSLSHPRPSKGKARGSPPTLQCTDIMALALGRW